MNTRPLEAIALHRDALRTDFGERITLEGWIAIALAELGEAADAETSRLLANPDGRPVLARAQVRSLGRAAGAIAEALDALASAEEVPIEGDTEPLDAAAAEEIRQVLSGPGWPEADRRSGVRDRRGDGLDLVDEIDWMVKRLGTIQPGMSREQVVGTAATARQHGAAALERCR